MAQDTIPETTPLQEPRQPRKALGMIVAVSLLLGASTATIYAKAGVAASLEVTPGETYTKEWTCDAPYVSIPAYGISMGPLSAAGLKVTLQGVELDETGETSFEFGRFEHVTAELVLVPRDGVTVTDWAFAGLIGDVSAEGDRALPGDAGVQVSCTGLSGIGGPVVNKETGDTPASAIYVTYGYTYGETGQIDVVAFVEDASIEDGTREDLWYHSAFLVHVVTKGINHDGTKACTVGVVTALVGSLAFVLMG